MTYGDEGFDGPEDAPSRQPGTRPTRNQPPGPARSEAEVISERMRRKLTKLLITCKAFGLTRDDRLSIAETILRRDVRSFSDLSDAELSRMLDALEGAVLVAHIVRSRQIRQRAR